LVQRGNDLQQPRPQVKRKASSPIQPSITHNRFNVLSEREDLEDTVDAAQSVSTPLPSPPLHQPTAKKSRDADYHTTPSGVHVFLGNKDEWDLNSFQSATTLLIGDSNLRNITRVPEGLTVVSLPGAHLRHTADAVKNYKPCQQQRPTQLIIQTGINHRDDNTADIDRWLEYLLETVSENQHLGDIFLNGVSISPELTTEQQRTLSYINDSYLSYARPSKGTYYIPPLPSDEVDVSSTDSTRVHYTPGTSDRILQCIVNAVNDSSPGSSDNSVVSIFSDTEPPPDDTS
jgi:hypothetical protein